MEILLVPELLKWLYGMYNQRIDENILFGVEILNILLEIRGCLLALAIVSCILQRNKKTFVGGFE